MKKEVVSFSILTCPGCHGRSEASMPTDSCVIIWHCPQCDMELKPKAGDCCIFCSYGDTPCPPIQREKTLRQGQF